MSNVDTVIQDLVIANRILAREEVVDAYGHVSIRNPDDPKRFFLSCSVSPELVESCERRLSEAAMSERLPDVMRWASAILAGRVASEYRYDYDTASTYHHQAQRIAGKDAIGVRTARWWMADALAQEGKRQEAAAIYEEILESTDIIDSQIIRRSRAILDQLKNR